MNEDQIEEDKEDNSGFDIQEAQDGPRACPNIIISLEEKSRLKALEENTNYQIARLENWIQGTGSKTLLVKF